MTKQTGSADRNEFEKREAKIKPRSKFFSHLSATVLTMVFIFGLFHADLQGLQGVLIDMLFRTQWSSSPHPAISIVAYNEESASRYQGSHKIPAEELLSTILEINNDRPLAIALVAPLNEKLYSDTELSQLSHVFSKVAHMYVGYTDNESLGRNAPRSLFHTTHYIPGYVSRDTFSYGADSVSRRVMLSIEGSPTLYSKLLTLYQNNHPPLPSIPKTRTEKFGDSLQTYIRWQGPEGTYQPHSTLAVIQKTLPKGTFTNKIVLISTTLKINKDADFIFTPFSREPFHTSLIEGAAHSLATLLNGDGIYKSSPWVNSLIAIFIGVLSVNLILYLSPGSGIIFLCSEIFLLFISAWVCFSQYHYWIDIAHPIVILCVSYYLVIPYRLVDEYKKRWHYQEKSEFMAELEQLKSNFLSLMSHDLKTPLARIQGNAELALSDSADQMTPKQKQSLQSIVHTTEGLSTYVETLLDLTRIESSKVHLNKSSKDINSVINEVVKAKSLLAREKQIEIQTKLEPLFSFKFDVKLIQQVIANLVENAIKYSPEGSLVTLTSKEDGSWVRVSVIDEGYGISVEDQDKLFSKFFRGTDPKTQTEKGTGLGLYLVKYFVELHEGFVNLNSQVEKGSVFTISLPI